MRQARQMRWIEEAEASAVLTMAQFERAPDRSWRQRIAARLAPLREWFAPGEQSSGWLLLQAQPVPVRRADCRRLRGPDDDARYGRW